MISPRVLSLIPILAACSTSDPRVDDLEARVSALEDAGDPDLEPRLAAVEAQLADIETRLSGVEGLDVTVGDLVTQQDALASDLADVQAAQDALGADLSTLQDDLAAVEASVTGIQGQVDGLAADVGGLTTDLGGLDADVLSLVASQPAAHLTTLADLTTISGTDTTIKVLGSDTVTAPAAGKVVAVLSGYTVIFGKGRTVEIGLGDSAAAIDYGTLLGQLDGTSTERIEVPFTVVGSWDVAAGASLTVNGLALGNSVFDAVSINIISQTLLVMYVPDDLP